jgi:peptidoglycan/LPS O-acetylase OafA/YrhL
MLGALTGIRFFAAFYVVIFHTRVGAVLHEKSWNTASTFFANGYLAVPLFFLLSGFILAYTYRGQIQTSAHRRRFWEARFARLWPVYAFSLLCMLSGIPAVAPALATAFMVQAWDPANPNLAGVWNAVCWTLSVEAFFYLTFPWIQPRLQRLARTFLFAAGAVSVAICIAFNTTLRTLGAPLYPGPFHLIPLPVIHMPEFLVGVCFGNFFLHRPLQPTGASRLPGAITYAGAALSFAALLLPRGRLTSFIMVGFALMVYGLASEQTHLARLLSTRLALLAGGISYSMYLLQTPVRVWMKNPAIVARMGNGAANMLLVPALLIVFSLATFLCIEEPARRLLRTAFAKLSSNSKRAV